MALKQVLETMDLLDGLVSGTMVAQALKAAGIEDVTVTKVESEKGSTEFLRIKITGSAGRVKGGDIPTLGIIGRLGGIGARPERIGLVSDADGAIAALATAFKIARMANRGDYLPGDVIIATHICPNAPTIAHEPVPFMDSPVDMITLNKYEVSPEMEAILSVDATKGNRILNNRGIAITATIKEGYVLPVSEPMIDILCQVTGKPAQILPISTVDITPYGNGLPHINSIVQPAVTAECPVVGVATTSVIPVAGCATGASHAMDLAEAVQFCLEIAKEMKPGLGIFYDISVYERMVALYGPMSILKTLGR